MISPAKQSGAAEAALLPSWQHLVGAPHSLRHQAMVGCVPEGCDAGHTDSWGIGWFDAAGQVSLVRQVGSAAESGYFVMTAEAASRGGGGSGPARTLIAHLRKASLGAVNNENAHPIRVDFTAQRGPSTMLVAHNGTVREPLLEGLREELKEADRRMAARSDNDTVVLASWLGLRAEGTQDLFESLTHSLTELWQRSEQLAETTFDGDRTRCYTAMNLLIAHADGLIVLRQFSREGEYYTLYQRPLTPEEISDGGCLIASERTDNSDSWQLFEPGVLTLFSSVSPVAVRNAKIAVF